MILKMIRKVGLLVLICCPMILVSETWAQTPATFFGLDIHSGILNGQPWPSVGFGSIRLWDTGTNWNDLEPLKHSYNWSTLDEYLALAHTHGVDVLFTFGDTAQWAASQTGSQCAYNSGGCYPPSNIDDWDNFVKALAAHSDGRIKYWELWNEANSASFWSGDMPTLLLMAQHAYAIIKATDPTAIILTPSSTNGSAPVVTFLNQYFDGGGLSYTDAVSFHGYPGKASPETIVNFVSAVKSVMASHGIGAKPIWDTEGGWGQNSILTSPAEGPGFLARQFILQWSSGVSRFYWYAWNNANWGTLWLTTGIQPAGVAYGQIYDWLDGATLSSPCAMAPDSTWTCPLTRPGGYRALAVWNSSATITYSPDGRYKQYRDLTGRTSSTTGSVTISPSPILLESNGAIQPPTNLTFVVR